MKPSLITFLLTAILISPHLDLGWAAGLATWFGLLTIILVWKE